MLDRRLAEQRIWPAIDLPRSGTRREEQLLSAATLLAVNHWRRALSGLRPDEAMQGLTAQLARHPSNSDFVLFVNRQAALDEVEQPEARRLRPTG